jgi:outer membrane protein
LKHRLESKINEFIPGAIFRAGMFDRHVEQACFDQAGSNKHVPRSSTDPMKSKFLRLILAVAAVSAISVTAQTGSPTAGTGALASPSALPSAPSAATTAPGGTKMGTININEAIFGSNEGQRDIQALQKKFEPKQAELKNASDELEALKKQMQTQQDKLNADALDTLKKQTESKQKSFDRSVQDAQEDFGTQQQDIAKKILAKMAPMIVKYSQDNGFGLIVDTSKPWPESPVLWWGEAADITKAVVDEYNKQSGVPAPAAPASGAAAKPPTSKPATGTTPSPKPSTPAAPKPN